MNKEFNTLASYLNAITDFPYEELEKLKSISKMQEIKKGDFFLREGDKVDNFAFVYQGLFRITYLHEKGTEFTKAFFPENPCYRLQ